MKYLWHFCCSLLPTVLGTGATPAELPKLPPVPADSAFTFAVLGDNRGDDTGEQPGAFLEVLQAVDRDHPAFVLDSGDMIYGHTENETQLRDEWRLYREATSRLRAPMFHIPGNHDVWDSLSARLYGELWGPTFYAFDYGNARFLGLDTETSNGRLGDNQSHWLEQQLASAGRRNVFVFLHRPLFNPSLGCSSEERLFDHSQVHSLFARHRDHVRAVFAGHNHLYDFQIHDGVSYYISGGAGAPLYAAPELGGFHHYLLVHVHGQKVEVELKNLRAAHRERQKPRTIVSGELLETWQPALSWYAWDHTTDIELTPEQASDGRQGLRLNFDPIQYRWPVLVMPLARVWDLRQFSSINLDVYVPNPNAGQLIMTPVVEDSSKHEGTSVKLQPGWNSVSTELNGPWLPLDALRNVSSLQWGLSGTDLKLSSYVVFDNLRIRRADSVPGSSAELLESWERPLLWRVFDETVRAETAPPGGAAATQGLLLHLDFSQCNRPVLFAQLNPPWDLTKVRALRLQVQTKGPVPEDLVIGLAFRAQDVVFSGSALPLHSDTRELKFPLERNWLTAAARAAADQVAFKIVTSAGKPAGDLVFKSLTAL